MLNCQSDLSGSDFGGPGHPNLQDPGKNAAGSQLSVNAKVPSTVNGKIKASDMIGVV